MCAYFLFTVVCLLCCFQGFLKYMYLSLFFQLIQWYRSKREHLVQITRSTPKMKKKARGMFALVEGDCEWVIFSGRNYKVLLFCHRMCKGTIECSKGSYNEYQLTIFHVSSDLFCNIPMTETHVLSKIF